MYNPFKSPLLTTALAIFSMFFGTGNLVYPILVGVTTGSCGVIGMVGFLITAVLLPLLGLVSMMLYDGDYEAFFYRLGVIPGKILIACCMMIMGVIVAIPRIVTLSHEMLTPFLPGHIPGYVFAPLFLGITFLFTYRENRIVDALGNIISPLLLISLLCIITKGFFTSNPIIATDATPLCAFIDNLMRGYGTLDLLSAIFFASMVTSMLKQSHRKHRNDKKYLAFLMLKSGCIAAGLLSLIYLGLCMLGMYHGHSLYGIVTAGELFREVALRVIGTSGQCIIVMSVVMACLSTAIALFAVVGSYLKNDVCKDRITFPQALGILAIASLPLSMTGLDSILAITTGPLTYVGYPILITLTLVNMAYKLWGFRPVKTPVFITGATAFLVYLTS